MDDSSSGLPYNLPDADLLAKPGDSGRSCVFVPDRVLVVIGKGSDPSLELHEETIRLDGVPVLRRSTGGCAVVLAPNMLVASLVLCATEQANSSDYFRAFNGVTIRSLESLGISDLVHAGISDIARKGRKIAGSAIYRNRRLVFYHAVINLAGGTSLMERYLKHPPRTPEYRANRTHEEFVTSLAAEGFVIEAEDLRRKVETEFDLYLAKARVA